MPSTIQFFADSRDFFELPARERHLICRMVGVQHTIIDYVLHKERIIQEAYRYRTERGMVRYSWYIVHPENPPNAPMKRRPT